MNSINISKGSAVTFVIGGGLLDVLCEGEGD